MAYWRLDGQNDGGAETAPGLAHAGSVPLRLVADPEGIAVGQSGPRPSDYRGLDADNRAVELLNTGPYPYFPAEYGNYLVTDRPVDLSGTGDFSMEMWFKHVGDSIGSSSTAEDFVSNADLGYTSDMYLFELVGSGSPEFVPVSIRYKTEFGGEATDFSVSVPEDVDWNAWHYLVFTKEASLGSIYLDGELLGTGTVSGDVTSTAETLGFGQDRSFKGLLDEIPLYNFGLTASDVAEHYAGRWKVSSPATPMGTASVDDKDASILGSHWLRSIDATWADGDFNNDGAVNDTDAAILAAHWGQGSEGLGERAGAERGSGVDFRFDRGSVVESKPRPTRPLSVLTFPRSHCPDDKTRCFRSTALSRPPFYQCWRPLVRRRFLERNSPITALRWARKSSGRRCPISPMRRDISRE